MLHLPRQPPGAAVRKRRGVWGAANSAWGWGGTPGPARPRQNLTQPPPRAGLEPRSGTLCHLPFSRGSGSDNRDSLVVNCPSQRPTSSSCLPSRLEKERELGRHSGSGPSEQLCTRVRGALLSSLHNLQEGRGPTRSLRACQAQKGVKRKAKFDVMERKKPLFLGTVMVGRVCFIH